MSDESCCAECGATATMPFETAYELYCRPLVRSVRQRATAWGLSERDVDVEALVQDTFVQALRVWDSIRVPRAWLYTVARRRLSRCVPTAALRANGDPADHTEQGTVSWTTVVPSASTEDLVAAREVIEIFRMMPRQRQSVAVLRYIEGWDFNEIAELLGCCPATARVHASKVRADFADRTLAQSIEGCCLPDSREEASNKLIALAPIVGGNRRLVVVLLVLGCVLASGFLIGWSWGLAAAGGTVTISLVGWAGSARHRQRSARRWGHRRLP
ncbi:RNA polymerase sigma factor [Streptomyces sp. enrichment culture]|uniref:RNA polymerase sigma factor n=1 Tax=Streptomyces sp. enrichment culture TaxID=1795815 RepID=UPI003F5801F5